MRLHMLERWGIDAETLHKDAVENTMKNFPYVFSSLEEVLSGLVGQDQMPEIGEDAMPLYLISNEKRYHGAGIAFCDKRPLEELSKKYGDDDIYILPSSTHEVLCLPAEGVDPAWLEDMVRSVNEEHVATSEILSNNVYRYDAETKEITLANKVKLQDESEGKEETENEVCSAVAGTGR